MNKRPRMDLNRMQSSAQKASDMMKLLGHPHRLMILCELLSGERSVGQLADKIQTGQSSLSQHLARMRHEGVVCCRRDAQTIYYSLVDGGTARIIALLYEIYCEQ